MLTVEDVEKPSNESPAVDCAEELGAFVYQRCQSLATLLRTAKGALLGKLADRRLQCVRGPQVSGAPKIAGSNRTTGGR